MEGLRLGILLALLKKGSGPRGPMQVEGTPCCKPWLNMVQSALMGIFFVGYYWKNHGNIVLGVLWKDPIDWVCPKIDPGMLYFWVYLTSKWLETKVATNLSTGQLHFNSSYSTYSTWESLPFGSGKAYANYPDFWQQKIPYKPNDSSLVAGRTCDFH